jgi:glycosyltransferase involved in cell wall biosynthesis
MIALSQRPARSRKGTSRPTRVLHLTLGLDMGGQEKLLVEFARHADRKRLELLFVSLTDRGCLAEEIEACGWPVETLQLPGGLRPRIIWRLSRLFRSWKPDVVHTHDDRPLIYGAPAARLARVPRVIHSRHGQTVRLSRRRRFLHGLAARMTARYVCVSCDIASQVAALGVAASRIETIQNGIDVARFSYHGPCPDGPALAVARLSPEKDLATLLHAVALVARRDPGFRLEIAGDGVCRSELGRLAAELRLQDHVHFLGQVSDVPALLKQARLFVLSSLSEGISLTILEAMARGLPVVATRAGGSPEVVVDGETGLLVAPGDAASLTEALLSLGRDTKLGRRMGLAGRRRVEAGFDVRHMVQSYEALYQAREMELAAQESRTLVCAAGSERPRVEASP